MARRKSDAGETQMMRPALTEEARENQLIALAVDLAEKQLREGTASSQVITHYLKLGSTKDRVEVDILKSQKKLIEAKTESIRASKENKELFEKAIEAMRVYAGAGDAGDEADLP